MHKNCFGCTKVFYFDENINPKRKFCGKDCYTNHVKKKPLEQTRDDQQTNINKSMIYKLLKFLKLK